MLLNRTTILSLAVAGLVAVPAIAETTQTYSDQASESVTEAAQDASDVAPAAGDFTTTTTTFSNGSEYDPSIESEDHPIKKSKRGRFGGHSVNE